MLALRAVRPRCGALPSVSASATTSSFTTSAPAAMPSEIKRRKGKHKQGLTPQKRAALARAKVFAEGFDKSKADVKAASEAARIETAKVDTSSSLSFGPSLDELMALRPRTTPKRFDTKQYATKHAKLFEAIDTAFVRGQIMALAEEFPLEAGQLPLIRTQRDLKATIVQRIMDQWGWVKPIEDAGTYGKPRTQEFPISPAELFLLQRDDKVYEWLGQFKHLRLSIVAVDSDGASPQQYLFTATDVPATLLEVDRFLHQRRVDYARLEWTAMEMQGFEPTRATLASIAQVTGAYVERTAKGTYLAIGPSSSDVQRARSMAVIAAARSSEPRPPLAATLPAPVDGSETYFGLTPHLPAMSSPLPWDTAAAVSGKPLFRITRNGVAGSAMAREAEQRAAHVQSAAVVPVNGSSSSSSSSSLSATINTAFDAVKPVPGGTPTLVLRFGHLLTPSEQASSLIPPVKGSWPLDASSPLASLPAPIFSPALPPALIQDPLPDTPARVRKVTYRRAGGTERLTVSYAYPVDETLAPSPASTGAPAADEPSWFLRLSDMLATPPGTNTKKDQGPDDFELDMGGLEGLLGKPATKAEAPEPKPLAMTFTVRTESPSDVLFPERPIDARVLAQSVRSLPQEEVPSELAAFFADVHAHPAAARVALSDLATLRKGTGAELPAVPEEPLFDDESWLADERRENRLEDELDDMEFAAHAAEARGTGAEDADGEMVPSDKSEAAAAPTTPVADEPCLPPKPAATEGDVLMPPTTVLYAQEQWSLERDEVLDVAEYARVPIVYSFEIARPRLPDPEAEPTATTITTNTPTASASPTTTTTTPTTPTTPTTSTPSPTPSATPATPRPAASPVTTRTVAAVDLRGTGGIVRYAELEAPRAEAASLYAELANASREMATGLGR